MKELTSLEHLKETLSNISIGIYQKVAEDISCIEKELIEKEEWDELGNMFPHGKTSIRNLMIILTNLGIFDSETLAKKLKALEFFKEKFMPLLSVDEIKYFKIYPIDDEGIEISKEEYDLLKEVLL